MGVGLLVGGWGRGGGGGGGGGEGEDGIEPVLVAQQHKQTRWSGVDLAKLLITYAVNTLFAFHKTHKSCVYWSPALDNKMQLH